jgi:hypothetical protein
MRWMRQGDVELVVNQPDLTPEGEHRWSWSNETGVRVVVDRIALQRAQRRPSEGFGDLSLFVLVLTLMVGVGQLNYLLQAWLGERTATTQVAPPSPELIARLLQRDFDGAESGRVARTQRPSHVKVNPSFYMPAGSQGPSEQLGGGERADGPAHRMPPSVDIGESTDSVLSQTPSEALANSDTLEIEPLTEHGGYRFDRAAEVKPRQREKGLPPSVERFIGWGFHDWLDASNPRTKEIADQLELARALMRLNPDEPYAILTVAYFAYLSENYTLCQDLYRRYTQLYPEDPAGWNNLALTFKRSGQYEQEERLYRKALALEPESSNTQNNLAVNLAHQGRFGEAEAIMDSLRPSDDERPYANLHRAKIAAAQGRDRKAVRYLRKALADVDSMDTFHHIEFRQDIRLDPALTKLRQSKKVRRLLRDAYGDDSPIRLGRNNLNSSEVGDG